MRNLSSCLRDASIKGKDGILKCEAKSCSFRFIPHPDNRIDADRTDEEREFLQHQLRTGSPENSNNRICLDKFPD